VALRASIRDRRHVFDYLRDELYREPEECELVVLVLARNAIRKPLESAAKARTYRFAL
jgi:hypothetical protein